MFKFRLDTFNNKQSCLTLLYIYIYIYVYIYIYIYTQNTKKYNNTVSHKQENPTQLYFPVHFLTIFRHHYMLSDFISYVVVIFSINKDIKTSFKTQQHKFLSESPFIFVYPADPT